MKKIYLFIALFVLTGLMAKSQCTVDTSNSRLGFWPADTSLPIAIQGMAYDTFVQVFIPAFVNDSTDTLRILSTTVDTIFGFPRGIGYLKNPASHSIPANGRACYQFSGSTTDTVGKYYLSFLGSVHVISSHLGDTVLNLNDFGSVLQGYGFASPFVYFIRVQTMYIRPCPGLDTTHLSGPGVYPVPSDLPCIVQNVPYDQTVQGRIQSDSTTTIVVSVQVHVDSVEIDSIKGMPAGITFGLSPRVLPGGGSGCVNFAGTSNDSVGTYPITAWGTAWLTASAAGQKIPVARRGNLNQYSSFGGYYLRVVNSPDSCHLYIPSGINDYFSNLNAEVSVFPNPNNGTFGLTINAVSPVAGQLSVYDAMGRKVYEQPLHISGVYSTTLNLGGFGAGLYFLQVSTPNGSALKKISVE